MIILTVILAIIAVVGFVATTALRKACDPTNPYERQARKKISLVRGAILAVCAVVFGIGVLIGGIKIIDQTEIGVVKVFGKIDHTISGGLNFVNPLYRYRGTDGPPCPCKGIQFCQLYEGRSAGHCLRGISV